MDKNYRLFCGKIINESGKIGFSCELCKSKFMSLEPFIQHQTMRHGSIRLQRKEKQCAVKPLEPVVREHSLAEELQPLVIIKRSDAAATQTTVAKSNNSPIYISSSDETILPGKFKCNQCRMEFNSLIRLDSHKDKCKPVHRITCDHCPKTFITTGGLRMHIHRHHAVNLPFVCDACPKAFNKPSELALHRRVHGTDAKVHCDFCNQRFLTKYERATHVKYDHPNDKYRCLSCSFQSKTIGVVRRHQTMAHGVWVDFVIQVAIFSLPPSFVL